MCIRDRVNLLLAVLLGLTGAFLIISYYKVMAGPLRSVLESEATWTMLGEVVLEMCIRDRYPVLHAVKADVLAAYEMMRECYEHGGKVLIAGNGGSCADSEHIVGELMKGFVKRRPVSGEFADALRSADPVRGGELAAQLQGSLPAIALTGHISLSTAFSNDVKGELTYAQQLYGYGKPGAVFIGISTLPGSPTAP